MDIGAIKGGLGNGCASGTWDRLQMAEGRGQRG